MDTGESVNKQRIVNLSNFREASIEVESEIHMC